MRSEGSSLRGVRVVPTIFGTRFDRTSAGPAAAARSAAGDSIRRSRGTRLCRPVDPLLRPAMCASTTSASCSASLAARSTLGQRRSVRGSTPDHAHWLRRLGEARGGSPTVTLFVPCPPRLKRDGSRSAELTPRPAYFRDERKRRFGCRSSERERALRRCPDSAAI
jgi:hypothetical protein